MARKRKLSKAEKIERDIRLNLRKQERAVEMQVKAGKMLQSSARALASLHRQQRRLDAKTADELVKTQVESPRVETTPPPKPAPKTVGEAIAVTLGETLKPKRQRKPKLPAPPTFRESPEEQEARETRMVSMGFRKTKRGKLAPTTDSK